MSKAKLVKLYVKQPLKGYAYNDGVVHEMPEEHAKAFKEAGRGLDPKDAPKPEEPAENSDLPDDIPYRKFLIDAGFKRLDALKNHKSLATIKHMNKDRAAKLQKYLDKH